MLRMASTRPQSSHAPTVLQLLQESCPGECIHAILSFAGARATSQLCQTNRFWKSIAIDDRLWESLCRPLKKKRWTQTWREAYFETVSVPQDFPTLHAAVRFCNAEFQRAADARTSGKHLTILLERDQTYKLEQPLVVQAIGKNACLTVDTILEDEDEDDSDSGDDEVMSDSEDCMDCDDTSTDSLESGASLASYQSSIVMDTLAVNQPLIQVSQGILDLKNTKLEHCSPIGNTVQVKRSNNAAIMMEPIRNKDYRMAPQVPKLVLDNVTMICLSGRGILNRCQAPVVMENSNIILFSSSR